MFMHLFKSRKSLSSGGQQAASMQLQDLHPKLGARRSAVEVARQLAKEGLLRLDEDLTECCSSFNSD